MYNLFYNLNDHPFGLKPDLKYFYTTRPHKRAIVHMRVGFEQPDGVLILTGEKGTGKTTLINYMLDQLDKNNNIVAFIRKPPQKDQDFLPAILAALQIPITERQPKVLFNTLHKYLHEQAKLNKKVLLIIDDAESLSHNRIEFIRLLSTLRLNEHGLIQIVLVGTNELELTLSANENQAFKEHISMSYSMHPLQASDTREYIEHRLKVAGWNGDPVIDADVFDAIQQLSRGVPYAINRYFDRLLMLGMLRKTHHINSTDVSNLTSATMEKLEKFDAMRMEQEKYNLFSESNAEQQSPIDQQSKKAAPVQQSVNGIDVEKVLFDAPGKKTKSYLNKQTIVTIAATFLVSSLSVLVYDKMSGNNLSIPFLTKSASHSENNSHSAANDHSAANNHSKTNNHSASNNHSTANNHSAVESSTTGHGSGSGTAKYVLEEFSSSEAMLSNNAQEEQLLDIQQLFNKSRKFDSEVSNIQTDENMASDTGVRNNSHSNSTFHASPAIASNAD